MLKRLIVFAALLATLSMLLCSCFLMNGTDGGEGDGGNNSTEGENEEQKLPEGGIYNSKSELYLIREEGLDEELFVSFMDKLNSEREEIVKLAAVDSTPHEHEIVIGDTDRAVSKEAKRLLGRLLKSKDSDVGIVIYSDGSSVAIVYDTDPDNITASIAINYFIDNYLDDELILHKGEVYSTCFDLVEGYGEVVDEQYESEMWALMEKAVGSESGRSFVNAMKQFYSIYSSDMVIWLADLYEPYICVCNALYGKEVCEGTKYCGGSGFYYSNSARDTAGYLPDVETTYQALMLLNSTGITRVSGGWKNMLDEDMLSSMGDFIRSIQEEDGNFVHPQWSHLELGISRKSRDLKWATELLEMMGLRPYYTTPTGIPGIGAPARSSSSMKSPLKVDTVSAVSSVILTAATLPELENDVSFKAYLNSLDIKHHSYSGGNQIASLLGQITARDAELKKEGADYRLIDILIDFLNENRNTETGTWDHTPTTDPKYSVYEGVNGLMKISAAYNTAKVVIPYAREACASAIAAITAEEKVGEAVAIYNPWHALTIIFGNLNEYGDSDDRALVNELRQTLYKEAPEMLCATAERVERFLKPGGCYSYNSDYSAAYSQGCPAAVLYSREGDVNGTVLCSSGLLDYMYGALGLKDCKVPLFGETERILFMEEIRSLNPGKKPPEDYSYTVEDFEEDIPGEEPIGQDISYKVVSNGASIKVVKRDDGEGNALRIDSKYFVNNSDSVTVNCRSKANLANSFVFEGDFCVLSTDRYYSVQIKMGAAYMFALKWENGKITLWECSSSSNSKSLNTKFDPEIELGDWFRVRVEYYLGDAQGVRIKFYFDNLSDGEDMELLAVTDNYYDEKGAKLNGGSSTPASTYENTLIYVLSDASVSMLIDNVASYKSEKEYTPEADPDSQPSFNVDAPDREEKKYSFSSDTLPEDMTVSGLASISDTEGGMLSLGGSEATTLTVPLNLRTAKANCAVLDTLIYVADATADTTVMNIIVTENTGNIFGFSLVCESEGGEKYLSVYEYAGQKGARLPGARIPLGEKTALRIEYYKDEDNSLIYIDGEFVGASTALYTGGASRTPARIIFSLPKDSAVLLDDTVAEKVLLDYTEATKPTKDTEILDLEDGMPEQITSVGASITGFSGSNAIRMGKNSTIAVSASKRSNLSSLAVFEADVTVTAIASRGELIRIALNDAEGVTVQALVLSMVSAKDVGLYEVLLDGSVGAYPLLTFELNETVRLRIEYFGEEKTTYIYKNKVLVARTNIIANADTYRNAVGSVELSALSSINSLMLDNLVSETVYESFADKTPTSEPNPETGKITFEKSSTGSRPLHLVTALNSDKAELRIEEMISSITGESSKVAVFVTGQENNDSIGISAEEDLSAYSAVVFEVDFMIKSNQTGPIYQLFFSRAGNAKEDLAYAIFINRESNGTLTLLDHSQSSTSISKSNTLATGINAKVWNTLRVEYYKGDHESVRMKIFVNGTLVFVSDNYFGYDKTAPDTHPAPQTEIKRVYFYSFLATEGEMYVDNMSLYGTNDVCTDSPTVK